MRFYSLFRPPLKIVRSAIPGSEWLNTVLDCFLAQLASYLELIWDPPSFTMVENSHQQWVAKEHPNFLASWFYHLIEQIWYRTEQERIKIWAFMYFCHHCKVVVRNRKCTDPNIVSVNHWLKFWDWKLSLDWSSQVKWSRIRMLPWRGPGSAFLHSRLLSCQFHQCEATKNPVLNDQTCILGHSHQWLPYDLS